MALIVAKESMRRSNNKEAHIFDTLALAHWENGNLDEVITTQKLAISLVDPNDIQAREEIETRLKEYRKAKAEADGRCLMPCVPVRKGAS